LKTQTLDVELSPVDNRALANLCGALDANLRQIESALDVSIARRGAAFTVRGQPAQTQQAATALERFYAEAHAPLSIDDIQLGLVELRSVAEREATPDTAAASAEALTLRTRRADLHGRTTNPGDLAQKVDPYLRPLYDALYDLMGFDKTARLFERNTIEIAPLAYMRGRTLNHSFIILDEAQNTTPEQMKMFLTRIGFGTKAVITGDVTQIDLARGQKSGLIEARRVLADVRGIAFTEFTAADVVRHPLVQKIISAYEKHTRSERIDAPGASSGGER
jgi:phosphate starvation-inducible PhoH-like protein